MVHPIESVGKNTVERRRGAHMPCKFFETNRRTGQLMQCYPLVDCTYNCLNCGWNPEVADARIRKMGFRRRRVRP